ncbi:MAG: serine--tRNA ligase [Candidatus Zapsychrus exili]|nr:serine--tRNA ligase [Candidatus Zapsychrus exili]
MFDIKLIRENIKEVKVRLKSKGVDIDLDKIVATDKDKRGLQIKLEDLRAKQNVANDEISAIIKSKKDPKEKIASMKAISSEIGELESKVKVLDETLKSFLIGIPNLPHCSAPVGDISKNKEIHRWKEPKKFSFKPKTHIEIAETLDIIDFKRATKITGSNFILFKGAGALLERALYNFMLDTHTREHGYKEVLPPVLVNRDSMTGTGQFPKMEDDMYKVEGEDLFLVPTAEVPVTNIYRDEILKGEDLPIYHAAYTPCFRKEAGSYGKDTKGLIRVHQFDKVELVKFVEPDKSYQELESLVKNAEKIFELLDIPYRTIELATGDLSFAAAKCYDIEAYSPGVDMWLEVSSCSNFEDFQARRASIRYKLKDMKKPALLHTLNGSGVALARTVVAILENYQTEEGDVLIPEVLQPYMHGLKKISSGD